MVEPSGRLEVEDWICDCVDQCERRVRNLERSPHFGDENRLMVGSYCLDVACLCAALKIAVHGLRGISDHSVSGDPAVARQLLDAMKKEVYRAMGLSVPRGD